MSRYERRFWVDENREAVFRLLSDPESLDRLTPDWFRLQPLSGSQSDLRSGCEISYRMRWRGLKLSWTSRIVDWRAPTRFTYEQALGPYSYFRHEHRFKECSGRTEVVDVVHFRTHGGRLLDRWIVEPDLARIFRFREQEAGRVLASRC